MAQSERHRCRLTRPPIASRSNEILLPRHCRVAFQIETGNNLAPPISFVLYFSLNWTILCPPCCHISRSPYHFSMHVSTYYKGFVRRTEAIFKMIYSTWSGPNRKILISRKLARHQQAYKIRIIFSFRGFPASVTSSLIKTNSCLTQSYPAICEVLQAELRPQIILTPFNKAVMLMQSLLISEAYLLFLLCDTVL